VSEKGEEKENDNKNNAKNGQHAKNPGTPSYSSQQQYTFSL
jgi:hypothetical protein